MLQTFGSRLKEEKLNPQKMKPKDIERISHENVSFCQEIHMNNNNIYLFEK